LNNAASAIPSSAVWRPHLDHKPSPVTAIIPFGVLQIGLLFAGNGLVTDIRDADDPAVTLVSFLRLWVALLIALGFKFVNAFHDTVNSVAKALCTRWQPPNFAGVWTGLFNFPGVLVSSGAIAFGILSLLPVEPILQVGSGVGSAVVFALLIATIREPACLSYNAPTTVSKAWD
jgi:PiT family inorganic phosphate transporter